jgi:hypothetical protein
MATAVDAAGRSHAVPLTIAAETSPSVSINDMTITEGNTGSERQSLP